MITASRSIFPKRYGVPLAMCFSIEGDINREATHERANGAYTPGFHMVEAKNPRDVKQFDFRALMDNWR